MMGCNGRLIRKPTFARQRHKMALTEAQLEHWRELKASAKTDAAWLQRMRERDQLRREVQPQLLAHLQQYLQGTIDNEAFRVTFDRRTRTDWVGFGLKGLSGAMFLNMLVKHIPDQTMLAEQLRSAIAVPTNIEQGRQKLQAFVQYLQDVVRSGQAAKREVQPGRVPFFISAWWHLQDVDMWPAYYESGRRVLEREGLFQPVRDVDSDYFHFREAFLQLGEALQMDAWQFEHLLVWLDQKGHGATVVAPEESEDAGDEPAVDEPAAGTHTHVQWLLATIGERLGCRIWIAANDRSKQWERQRLGDMSLAELPPLGMIDPASRRIIERIDVLWLKGANQIVAAFEIEHTTSIYSGLLRMSDLVVLSPNLNFPLYIVAPEARLEQVRRELSRPTFQTLELHRRCGFFSDEALIAESDSILRWANDPSAIDRLAARVGDAGEGDD
jgi:hypothetical protein